MEKWEAEVIEQDMKIEEETCDVIFDQVRDDVELKFKFLRSSDDEEKK